MNRVSCLCLAVMLFLFSAAVTAAEGKLVKAPGRASIAAEGAAEETQVNEWVTSLLQAKEKKALTELEQIKKQVKAEAKQQLAQELERRKRQDKFESLTGEKDPEQSERVGPIHIKIEFAVPEIETYQTAAAICKLRQALANDIVQKLGQMSDNRDGKLVGDSYLEVAALISGSAKLQQKIEGEGGFLTHEDLAASAALPRTAADAISAGQFSVQATGYRIKTFDADGNGELDVSERKALAMAYADIAVKAGKDAAFYTLVANALTTARDAAAAKFADVEVTP